MSKKKKRGGQPVVRLFPAISSLMEKRVPTPNDSSPRYRERERGRERERENYRVYI